MTFPVHRQFGSRARVAQQILALVPAKLLGAEA